VTLVNSRIKNQDDYCTVSQVGGHNDAMTKELISSHHTSQALLARLGDFH
jgi:hypothetical protein